MKSQRSPSAWLPLASEDENRLSVVTILRAPSIVGTFVISSRLLEL